MQIYKWVPARVEEQPHEKQLSDPKQAVPQQNGLESTSEHNGIQISPDSQEKANAVIVEDQANRIDANGSSQGSDPEQANSNNSNTTTNNNNDDKIMNDDPPSNNEHVVPQLSSLDRKTPETSTSSPTGQQKDAEQPPVTKPKDISEVVVESMPADDNNKQSADKDVSELKSCKVESMEVDEEVRAVSNPQYEAASVLEVLDAVKDEHEKVDKDAEKVGQVEPESTTKDCKPGE